MEELVYTVDHDGRLSSVNAAWDAFARANDAPDLLGDRVVGQRLLDHITGAETRQFTSTLMTRAREEGEPVTIPFQCDGSRARRRMVMIVTATADGYEFRTRPEHVGARADVRLLDRDRPTSDDLLKLCSWCNRVRVEERWVEIEEAAEHLRFVELEVLPAVTHGICEPCADSVMAEWRATQPPARK